MKAKRFLNRIIALTLALVCVMSVCCSCALLQDEEDDVARLIVEGESPYVIVSGSRDKAGWQVANLLSDYLLQLTGVEIDVIDDRTPVDADVPEIRVGKTNRGTDYGLQRALRVDEYVISREGKNIYILGIGEEMLTRACDFFTNEVLDDAFAVTAEGEIKRESGTYAVTALSVNERPVTDYTLLTPAKAGSVDWSQGVMLGTEALTAVSGYIMPTATYTDAEQLPCSPAIVLCAEPGDLDMTEYRVEVKGDDIYVSAGATMAALRIMDLFTQERIKPAKGVLSLTVSAKKAETGMSSAAFSVMSFNILGPNKDHTDYATAAILDAAPDFVCTQEFYTQAATVAALKEGGYGLIGEKFTEVSPTALENAATDSDYQTYAHVGKQCATAIFYRADLWEPIEEDVGSYLFYWKSRYHLSNTKSLTYGVFRSKVDGELVLVISTHFPLMTDSYKDEERESMYFGLDNTETGIKWRSEAILEVLGEVERLQTKYPDILTVVAGDFNAKVTEDCLKTIEASNLSNAYDMAPESARTEGASFHSSYGKAPSATGQPIDHIYVSEELALVTAHHILQTESVLQASDHCPVVAQIYRK